MSSPAPSNISQNNAELLEEQHCEMQQWHEEEQQLLLQLQEAVEAHCTEHAAQKARREMEAKAKEETEKQRIVEKKKKLEYIQQLQNEVLEEEAALLERAEGSQIVGSKCKEVTVEDEEKQWPSKKARGKQPGKYCIGTIAKIGGSNPAKGVCVPGRIAWYTSQDE